ncbi:hypothetical protein [Rhodospirillaceae bacterium SYSU D60014]|uniref:hypothetical protein n=1 Tax=Virgifigura deserti TaxID=2268457 RepID=UPI000E66DC0A
MAFESRELSVLAYANGFTLWHYRTEDSLETLTRQPNGATQGYFDAAREMVRSGDQIIVNLIAGGRVAMASLAVTVVDPAGSVGVAALESCVEPPVNEAVAA